MKNLEKTNAIRFKAKKDLNQKTFQTKRNLIESRNLTPTEILILETIMLDSEYFIFKPTKIAEYIGIDVKTVKRAIDKFVEKGYAKKEIRNNVGKNIYYNYSFADYPKFLEENKPLEVPIEECIISNSEQITSKTYIEYHKKSIIYPKEYENLKTERRKELEKYIEDLLNKRYQAEKKGDIRTVKINDDLLTEKELEKKLNQLKIN
jgi:predicted transcriptional regulator